MLRNVLQATSSLILRSTALNAHLLCACLCEGRLGLLHRGVFFLGNAIRVVRVFQLSPTWHLIVTVEGVALSVSLRTLQKSARLGSKDVLCVKIGRSHLVLTSLDVGENSETLCRSLSTGDISSLETSTVGRSIFGRIWHPSGLATVDGSDLSGFAVLIHYGVGWVERVRATLRLSLNLGHISVVISGETADVLSWLVSLLCTSALDVIDQENVAGLSAGHGISLWPCLVDVVDCHRVPDVPWWSSWSDLDLSELVARVQWVVTLTLRLELYDLWCGTLYVASLQVSLVFVQTNVQSSWTTSVNVPV